jgi:hypothetical protein
MSSQQFIELLYGQLPEFVKNEAELQAIISAEHSDLFDVLAQEKLAPLLRIRYQNSIADAVTDLGKPEQIRRAVQLRGRASASTASGAIHMASP